MSRKTATNFAIIAAASCLGLYLSRGPWVAYRQQKQKADAAGKDVTKAESEKTDLLREKAIADSPMGHEKAARAVGYLKKGEQSLNQEHTDSSSDTDTPGR